MTMSGSSEMYRCNFTLYGIMREYWPAEVQDTDIEARAKQLFDADNSARERGRNTDQDGGSLQRGKICIN